MFILGVCIDIIENTGYCYKRNLKFSGHRNYSNPNQVHELMLFDTAIEATQDETAKYTNDMGDFIKWMFGFLNLR